MSGTSLDGVDTAWVEIEGEGLEITARLVEAHSHPYSPELKRSVRESIYEKAGNRATEDLLAQTYASALASGPVAELLGCHGQTIFHDPPNGLSLQIGTGQALRDLIDVPLVCNFRAADLRLGGQGAPIVPRIDAALLSSTTEIRAVHNIGGIGNVTYLPKKQGAEWIQGVRGFDTGPGNGLIDLFCQHLVGKEFDQDGVIAKSGKVSQRHLSEWLKNPYIATKPPKSLDTYTFGSGLFKSLPLSELPPEDWLATATAFTARSIHASYQHLPTQPERILLCGGGARNTYLVQQIQELFNKTPVELTDAYGLNSQYKEAIAMAVLAYWNIQGQPGNLPSVTGASNETVLGRLFS